MWKRYRRRANFVVDRWFRIEKHLFSSAGFVYRCYLPVLDFLRSLVSPRLRRLHRRLRQHLVEQEKAWPGRYSGGYFYQGLDQIGITGVKPTEFRFRQYDIDGLLDRNARVLDVGSNCGFVAIYCAQRVKQVDAVELNPYLNRIAAEAAAYLGVRNLNIHEQDFTTYDSRTTYDIVLSFSNHHTIDGNLSMGFDRYIEKLQRLLRDGGYLLFESHNVFGPGNGGAGDDGDMDAKVAIMNRHFDILRYRMVECYLPPLDIDKLFIVARKANMPRQTDFALTHARSRYHY